MRSKILTFIIGALVGVIITTAGFFIYEKINNNGRERPNGGRLEMMNKGEGETQPRKPDGEQEDNEGNPLEVPSNST